MQWIALGDDLSVELHGVDLVMVLILVACLHLRIPNMLSVPGSTLPIQQHGFQEAGPTRLGNYCPTPEAVNYGNQYSTLPNGERNVAFGCEGI